MTEAIYQTLNGKQLNYLVTELDVFFLFSLDSGRDVASFLFTCGKLQ